MPATSEANPGRPWLNKQITKIYRQKLFTLTAFYFYRQKLCKIILANLKNLFSVIGGFWFPDSGFWFPIPDSGFRFQIPVSGFWVLGLPSKFSGDRWNKPLSQNIASWVIALVPRVLSTFQSKMATRAVHRKLGFLLNLKAWHRLENVQTSFEKEYYYPKKLFLLS